MLCNNHLTFLNYCKTFSLIDISRKIMGKKYEIDKNDQNFCHVNGQ
jgi:hypothetical protein